MLFFSEFSLSPDEAFFLVKLADGKRSLRFNFNLMAGFSRSRICPKVPVLRDLPKSFILLRKFLTLTNFQTELAFEKTRSGSMLNHFITAHLTVGVFFDPELPFGSVVWSS